MTKQFSWFGIDFGTTNSAASSMTGDIKSNVQQINYGDDEGRPFPSLVAINKKTGKVITGREAKTHRNQLEGEYKYFSSIKSIIGSDQSFVIAGRSWSPVDIAAEIFKGLKERIGRDRQCKEAIVAVPVGFTAEKKRNLRKAASAAGIEIKMFVSEPTAAYCSNYAALQSYKNVAVFDWGGGTLDIAVLHIERGRVYEVSTGGMAIAGDNIDKKMAEKMHLMFCKSRNVQKAFEDVDEVSRDMLLERCEDAKIAFSDGEDYVRINLMKYDQGGIARGQMDYETFSELIDPEVEMATDCLREVIKKSGLNKANLDCILCVGGSSKLRPLKEKLINEYGEELLFYPQKVMWDIAKGASLISMSSGHYGLNHSIGLLLNDGEFYPLIEKGQPLPCRERKIKLCTTNDDRHAKFVITDSKSDKNRSFIQYVTVPAGGFLEEEFEVSCFIDKDNLFRMCIRSNRFTNTLLHTWTYDNIKVFYQLERK